MVVLWKSSLVVLLPFLFIYPQLANTENPIGLKLSLFGPNHIKGKYLYSDSFGLQFDIRSEFMEIKTLDGNETISLYMKLPRDTTYFQIADQGFLSRDRKEILVPRELSKNRRVLQRFAQERFSNIVVNPGQVQALTEAHKDALGQLRNMEETRLLQISSEALAQAGGSGLTLSITQPYHLTSLNLLLALDRAGKTVDVIRNLETQEPEASHRTKRCADLSSDPNNDNCFGMCGRKCNCWSWVCGDCCHHHGCWQHDYCCRKDFYSKYCLLVSSYDFSCSSYGGYYYC